MDDIATWKTVRTISWIGLGVGLATAGAGFVATLAGDRSETSTAPLRSVAGAAAPAGWVPAVAMTGARLELSWTGSF